MGTTLRLRMGRLATLASIALQVWEQRKPPVLVAASPLIRRLAPGDRSDDMTTTIYRKILPRKGAPRNFAESFNHKCVAGPFGNDYNLNSGAMGHRGDELFAGAGARAEIYEGHRRRDLFSERPARYHSQHQPGNNPQMGFNNQAPNLGYNRRPELNGNPPMQGRNPPPQFGNNPPIVLARYLPVGYMVLPPMMGMGFGNIVPIAVPVYQANDAPVNMGPIIPQRFENNLEHFEERGAHGGVPNAVPNPPAQRQGGPQSYGMAGYPAGMRNLGNQMRRNDVMAAADEVLILEQPEDEANTPSSDLASAFKYAR
ncbi:unnamed protein product, partial [Iphiclides podalirius]